MCSLQIECFVILYSHEHCKYPMHLLIKLEFCHFQKLKIILVALYWLPLYRDPEFLTFS